MPIAVPHCPAVPSPAAARASNLLSASYPGPDSTAGDPEEELVLNRAMPRSTADRIWSARNSINFIVDPR